MASLRAFVGHSFTSEDKAVVDKFLAYLGAIEELNPNFSWKHAEHPEPSAIGDKVLRLFDDANLFIGICTRKEFVVRQENLKSGKLFANRRYAQSRDFDWKTSDWIIQEIGLAVGRGLRVILLVEEGVRSPGGIQGSLEYIPFSRDFPEQSFEKLLQMVASLSSEIPGSVEVPQTSSAPTKVEGSDSAPDWLSPNHTWHRNQYEFAYMHFTAVDDADQAVAIEQAFQASAVGSSPEEKQSWSAFTEYMRIQFGRGGRVENIVKMTQKNPCNSTLLKYLALSYKALDEDQIAARVFFEAYQCESTQKEKIDLLMGVVSAAAEKDTDLAEKALLEIKAAAANDASLGTEALLAENLFSKARKESSFSFASMERILEQRPDDHSMRFDLAYAYSDAGMADMALYHYLRIPHNERGEAAWNNLGVAYENQKLPINSVYAYKKSISLGGTLAASNLTYRFLHAGFLDEARDACESASGVADHHKNVDNALSQVKEALEKEREAEEKIVVSARDVSGFYRRMGEALVSNETPRLVGAWLFEGSVLRITVDDGRFSAQGTIEESAASTSLRHLFGTDKKPELFDVTISGVIRGRAVYGSYEKRRRDAGSLPTIMGGQDKESVVLFISSNGDLIEILRGSVNKREVRIMKRMDRPIELVASNP